MSNERCETCRFWMCKPRWKRGQCRRFPPIIEGAYPAADSTSWCGEWKAKAAEVDDGD